MLMRRAGQPIDGEKTGHLDEASVLVWEQIAMIDTVRHINRMEGGEMPLTLEPCDVEELLMTRSGGPPTRTVTRSRLTRPATRTARTATRFLIERVASNLAQGRMRLLTPKTPVRARPSSSTVIPPSGTRRVPVPE